MFSAVLPLRSKAFVKWAYWKSKFQNAPNSITDLYDTSLICTKFGAFTIIGMIVQKDCTYPPD